MDTEKDLDVVMSMYNSIEYRDDSSKYVSKFMALLQKWGKCYYNRLRII